MFNFLNYRNPNNLNLFSSIFLILSSLQKTLKKTNLIIIKFMTRERNVMNNFANKIWSKIKNDFRSYQKIKSIVIVYRLVFFT